jgi:hypothetical protein
MLFAFHQFLRRDSRQVSSVPFVDIEISRIEETVCSLQIAGLGKHMCCSLHNRSTDFVCEQTAQCALCTHLVICTERQVLFGRVVNNLWPRTHEVLLWVTGITHAERIQEEGAPFVIEAFVLLTFSVYFCSPLQSCYRMMHRG